MSRYIYEWKSTEHGRRLFRRPGGSAAASVSAPQPAPAPEPEPEPEANDYSSLLKDELIAEAEARGLDSSGNKADIIERLEADDGD